MDYTKDFFESVVTKYGEVFFVLESDREYEIHGTDSYEFFKVQSSAPARRYRMVRIEGKRDDEWLKVEFPLDAIEHHYTHREV